MNWWWGTIWEHTRGKKKGEWAFLFNSRNLAFWARALHLLNWIKFEFKWIGKNWSWIWIWNPIQFWWESIKFNSTIWSNLIQVFGWIWIQFNSIWQILTKLNLVELKLNLTVIQILILGSIQFEIQFNILIENQFGEIIKLNSMKFNSIWLNY